jgi:hypothetical protein
VRKLVSIIAMGAAALSTPASAVEVVDSVFQVTFKHNGQDYAYNDTKVPLLAGNACYNWYLRLDDPASTAEVTAIETFRLPEPLPAWLNYVNDPAAAMQIDPDGMQAVTKLVQAPADGWISNGWCAAEGDPLGPHSFAVSVEGGPATNFEFSVVAPEDYVFEEAAAAAPPTPFVRSPTERSVNNSW